MKVELISITDEAEKVIELAGRTSYKTFHKMNKGSAPKFIQMIISKGHLSVLEHAVASFKISGVSRSLTHQLVRHRLASFIQQSQRYVSAKDFEFITPPSIFNNKRALNIYLQFMKSANEVYKKLLSMKILKEDARYVLPNSTSTEIVMTANFREYRHIFKLRCSKHAQWEIRELCIKMLEILQVKAPSVFNDFKINYKERIAITEYNE